MQDLLVERFFLVAVELTDGRSTQLKVRGETPAEAFKEVRSRADVRRVGKVTEIGESAFQSDKQSPSARPSASEAKPADRGSANPGQTDRHPRDRRQGEAHRQGEPKTPREALIGFTISGPRVIRAAKPLGYEQPVKNFRARPGAVNLPPPPEPNKPKFSPFGPVSGPVANDPSRPPVFARPTPVAEAPKPTPQPAEVNPSDDSASSGVQADASVQRDYRIVKSRRQSGEPYLLQRGTWGQLKGKRAFNVEWEKGFESREKAEKQQAWLLQMAVEAAELQSDDE